MASKDFSGKKVGYFGSGDQGTFSDTFMDGIAIIDEEIQKTGAAIIGKTSVEGYEFNESRAVKNGEFFRTCLR